MSCWAAVISLIIWIMSSRVDNDFSQYLNYDELVQQALELEGLFSHHGLLVKPSSRIGKYIRVLRKVADRVHNQIPISREEFVLVSQALSELSQIRFIVSECARQPETSGWRQSVARIISGSDLPQHDSEPRQSRNTQFELYLAALSKLAGYEIRLTEPDILIIHQTFTFGIAAKRPKSIKHMHSVVRGASKQIVASAHDGAIAFDVTQLHNPMNTIAHVQNADLPMNTIKAIAEDFMLRNHDRIKSAVDRKKVFAVLVYMSGSFFIETTGQIGTFRRISSSNLIDIQDSRVQNFRSFVVNLAEALDKQMH